MNTIKNALPALVSLSKMVKDSINSKSEPVKKMREEDSYKDIFLEGDYDSYMSLTMIADALKELNNAEDASDFMKKELAPVSVLLDSLKEKIQLREKTLEIEERNLRNIIFSHYEKAEEDMRSFVNFDDIVILNIRITSLSEEKKEQIVKRMEEQGFVKVDADSERKYCFLCEIQNQDLIKKMKNYFYKIIEDIVNNPNIKGDFSIIKATGGNMVNTLA